MRLPPSTLVLPLALLASAPRAQEGSAPAPESEAVAAASPEARALWEKVCAASGSASREPLRAFQLRAEVLTRSGVQTNETEIDYRYLAPDCIRFVLPSKNETGRFGPAPEQYWLKSGDQVVVLAGREYKEDRKAVDDMLALAKNYVALSNPARLNLLKLEELPAAPEDLPPKLASDARKLAWLALESPDFALVRGDVARETQGVYRVELGLRGDHLPAIAIVRARSQAQADPLLVEFADYHEQDQFKIPFQLRVHVLDGASALPRFAEKASQEVYVSFPALRAPLSVADFQPRK